MSAIDGERRRRLGLGAIAALVLASAVLLQPFGYNQGAHYALVRALADGTPRIDAYQDYTGDESYFHGHYYSNKAPGLAFVTLPAYAGLRAVGLPSGVHALTLWGVLLPAALLLLLVRWMGERLEPGLGTATAITLGAATLVLPFSSLYFAHALSALLGFAAFAALWRERDGPERAGLVVAAGVLAGFAVTTEYPLAIVAVVLGLYAVSRRPVVRRGLLYAGGFVAGIVPLLVYDRWAFGSFTHLSYSNLVAVKRPGGQPVVLPRHGSYGLHSPKLRVALELLLSWRGLLTLAPVVALGGVGVALLWRRGRRAEAGVIAAVAVAFLVYNAAFLAFGGYGPGPRYLVPALPFLAVTLAPVWRRFPATTLALAAVSAGAMVLATATEPLLANNELRHTVGRYGDLADTGRWLDRLWHGDFTRTVFTSAGLGHGWIGIAPFLLLVAVALALATLATGRLPLRRADTLAAAVAVAGWVTVLVAAPRLLQHDRLHGGWLGAAAAFLLAVAVMAATGLAHRRR